MKNADAHILSTLIAAILSTKGGVAKTTDTANLGGYLADQGLKVLMIDADIRQPTLSSYYPFDNEAPGGVYELIAQNELDPAVIISHTTIPGLDIIISNDPRGELMSLLQAAPDGVISLRHLVRQITGYDVILIDTIGARTIALEMVLLASDLIISPVLPEMLSAREFLRGTLQMYRDLQPFTRYGIPLAQDAALPESRRNRLWEMGEAMNMFCSGFEGELFNREGEAWPEADITLVDLAMFAREGYEAQLAIAYISLINHINNLGERDQHLARPIVNITDEAHIITVNPLLTRFLTKGSKMWRKLGIWLWLATQNLSGFPDDAKKLLNMIEWWELLVMPPEEVEQVSRFKSLTPESTSSCSARLKHRGNIPKALYFRRVLKRCSAWSPLPCGWHWG